MSQGVFTRVSGQLRCGGRIQVDGRIRVLLEKRGCDVRVDIPLDRALDDERLVLAGGDEGDLLRLEDRRDPHGDGLGGDVLLAEEIGRCILAGDGVEPDQARARLLPRARLVEADVASPADAQDLEVDAARAPDVLLVLAAHCVYFGPCHITTREVDVLLLQVHVLEEVLPHEAVITVDAVRTHRVVLVQVERHHRREVEPLVKELFPSWRRRRITSAMRWATTRATDSWSGRMTTGVRSRFTPDPPALVRWTPGPAGCCGRSRRSTRTPLLAGGMPAGAGRRSTSPPRTSWRRRRPPPRPSWSS